MKHALKAVVVVAACGLLAVGASPAEAKGCLKGAVVGGVGGHMAPWELLVDAPLAITWRTRRNATTTNSSFSGSLPQATTKTALDVA